MNGREGGEAEIPCFLIIICFSFFLSIYQYSPPLLPSSLPTLFLHPPSPFPRENERKSE